MGSKKSVLVFGDSHTVYFGPARQLFGYKEAYQDIVVDVNVKHGAAIAGFGKRESTTNVKKQLINKISQGGYDALILNFGQVDVELGLFYRQFVKKECRGFEEHVSNIADTYVSLIESLNFPNKNILVKGLNLPVLCYSKSKWLEYINRIITENIDCNKEKTEIELKMRANFLGDKVRTRMTIYFNQVLKRKAEKKGIKYTDINDKLIDPTTGLISLNYIPCKIDHHLIDSVGVREMHWNIVETFLTEVVTLEQIF